jgi:streptogramin lyase
MFLFRVAAVLAWIASLSLASVETAKAAGITVYALPVAGYMPDSLVRAANGSIWFSAAQYSPCHGNVTCQTEAIGTLEQDGAHETLLGRTGVGATYGVTPGPARTLWLTDAQTTARVFDLSGTQIAEVKVRTGNGDGALSAPFIGPDGRMWFTQGSFGQGATGVVAVDASYDIEPVASCGQCFFSGGVVAADGDAWLLDPYLGGFYRVTPAGAIKRFDYGQFVLDTMIAGPGGDLWGTKNGNITSYDLSGHVLATFVPPVSVQSGLRAIGGNLVWAAFGPAKGGGTELEVVRMSPLGKAAIQRYRHVGTCRSTAKQWFSQGPAVGGDRALYVAIGCSPEQAPYTDGGQAAIVKIELM